MKRICSTFILVALSAALGGCAVDTPAGDGASVRAIFASQTLPPQPHGPVTTDGTTAVAAYGNYQQSYAVPATQGDRSTFGLSGKK